MTLASSMPFAARWQFNYVRRKAMQRLQTWRRTVATLSDVSSDVNVVLITVAHELAETQIYPFHFYRTQLRRRGIRVAQVPLSAVLEHGPGGGINRQVRRVFFQPEFNMPPEQMVAALQSLQTAFPTARIAFMDWFAPLHLHPAVTADPFIDIYIKKQVFRRFEEFQKPVLGDTNLSDFYARKHNLQYDTLVPDIPPGLEGKLRLWSNFGLSPQMVDLFLGDLPDFDNKDIDLHARLAVNGEPWYKAMRQEAKDAVDRLEGISIAREGRVRRDQFFAEMARSKICFSPFGYGEVCWRDYEAFATGALLVKPEMKHICVEPDVFVDGGTYVPVSWGLEDLSDIVQGFLMDKGARLRICKSAHSSFREWMLSMRMVDLVAGVV